MMRSHTNRHALEPLAFALDTQSNERHKTRPTRLAASIVALDARAAPFSHEREAVAFVFDAATAHRSSAAADCVSSVRAPNGHCLRPLTRTYSRTLTMPHLIPFICPCGWRGEVSIHAASHDCPKCGFRYRAYHLEQESARAGIEYTHNALRLHCAAIWETAVGAWTCAALAAASLLAPVLKRL